LPEEVKVEEKPSDIKQESLDVLDKEQKQQHENQAPENPILESDETLLNEE
jgi:hypothetical protein